MNHNKTELVKYLKEFTETFQQFNSVEIEMRELACLRVQFPFILKDIEPQDLFAGRMKYAPIGFSPQYGSGFGYYIDEPAFQQLFRDSSLSPKEKKTVRAIYDFWETGHTPYKTKSAYPETMSKILASDNWNGESGIAFPLYRMSGSQLNVRKLITHGIPGLRDEIQNRLTQKCDLKSKKLFRNMLGGLDLLAEICRFYANKARTEIVTASDNRKHELEEMAFILEHISDHSPRTFRQAIQLAWLYFLLAGTINYGRFDDNFGDFYEKDVGNGYLTRAKARTLLKSLWTLMHEREQPGMWRFDSRVILGGKGRQNEQSADQLALLAMEATHEHNNIIPQLTLRFYKGQNPGLYQKALDMIGAGLPYPLLYNDDVNIPSVKKAFNISEQEAEQYLPFGCGEYVIDHKSFATPSGVINLLQALLVTLHQGKNPATGQKMGFSSEVFRSFDSFDALYKAYQEQVEYHIDQLAAQEKLEYDIAGQTAPFLFFSILFDDCIDRGRAVFDGGIRYLGGTLETYGNTNVADSLTAIKKCVFQDQFFTLEELITMLDDDFEGFELQRRHLLKAPKYGNDNDQADSMLVDVDRHVCEYTHAWAAKADLHHYLVVIINNDANTVMGRYTMASPDGRKAGSPMNNGNAPSSGFDKNGLTAFLNSIVKPLSDIHAGAVQNMKFSKELFQQHRDKLDILLDTYWEQGGTQAMINCIGRNDLERAIEFPEEYQNLIVRVGGFCARFVDLAPDVQQEILERTLY